MTFDALGLSAADVVIVIDEGRASSLSKRGRQRLGA
jgi:hypothetical protein